MNEHGAIRTAHSTVACRRAWILAVTLTVAAVMAAACVGSDAEPGQVATPPAPVETPPAPVETPPAPPADSSGADDVMTLPNVEVVDVGSGESIVLSSLAPADRPILAWFWAPH